MANRKGRLRQDNDLYIGACKCHCCNTDSSLRDLDIPQSIAVEEKLKLSGEAFSAHGRIRSVEAVVTDASGREVARVEQTVQKRTFSLSKLKLPALAEGGYTLQLSAAVETPYIGEDQLIEGTAAVRLLEEEFYVGPMPRIDHLSPVTVMEHRGDGWVRENGTWYYYENAQPCTGWLREHGIRYYLDENGAVTTGWAEVDGQTCLFSDTGALCTGWIRDTEGMRYCSKEGRFANGLQTIDGARYYFEQGILQTEGTVTDGVEVYKLQSDGKAILLAE